MRPTRSLTFVVTASCNLHCEYCYIRQQSRTALEWNTLRRVLDRTLAGRSRPLDVSFTGGEPLVAFSTVRRAIEYVAGAFPRARVRWRVQTNGLLLDTSRLSFLEDHDVRLYLSMDGVAAAQDLRGRGTFARMDALLGRMRRDHRALFDERLIVQMTLCPSTMPLLARSVGYLLRKQVRNFSVAPAMAAGTWQPGQIAALRREFSRVTDRLRRHYERAFEVPFMLFRKTRPDPPATRRRRACGAGNGAGLVVDVDGDAYGCVLAAGTYRSASPPALRPALAALHAGPATSARLSHELARMSQAVRTCDTFWRVDRKYSSYGRCADCEFLGRCHVCPLACAPLAEWPDPDRVPDFLCAYNRVALACRDRFPCQPDLERLLDGPVRTADADPA